MSRDEWLPGIAAASAYRLARAHVPACLIDGATLPDAGDGLVAADIVIEDGRIAAIAPPVAEAAGELPVLDLHDRFVWPGFVDMHTHLDKGHIWPRRPNPDGSFRNALSSVADDRSLSWSADDVRRRMEFSLRTAYAHGTVAIRTHLDSIAPQHEITWPVLAEIRDEWRHRIALQAASIIGVEAVPEGFGPELAATVARHGGILGVVTYMIPQIRQAIDEVFRLAAEHGLDLDLHVDETGDPAAISLRLVAEAAIRHRFEGHIVCGHCCSLAAQDSDEAARTLDLVAEAGIAIVSLPMCNMYLQGRDNGRTPRWRGVTLLHEMRDRDIPVAVASDNTRDPFYAWGDLDPLEVFREAVRIFHLDHPIGDWPALVTRWPTDIMGLGGHGRVAVGAAADLVICEGRNYSEILARPEANRTVLRAGKPIDRTLPDYRELDDLMVA